MYSASDREEISRLTREGLAAAKRRGIRLGRPSRIPPEVLTKVCHLRGDGFTLQAIANELNATNTPTVSGRLGRWTTSSVQSALATYDLNRQAGAILRRQDDERLAE